MKILTHISRFLVGILFIFSGLIKLNDPVGFSFKLQDYFAPNVLDLPFFVPYALFIAVFLVVFEVVLGVMLLMGYKPKFTVWSLLLMIIFFTFLTFYSAYYNKVTDCGCFGDAIKLTPWESFTKDIILLAFIFILFFNKKHIRPLLGQTGQNIVVFATYTLCLVIAYVVLMHLPFFDFRAYKIGTNIKKGMEMPEGAEKSEYEMIFVYKINDVATEISYDEVMAGNVPEDAEFMERKDKLIKQGYIPPIHDFSIEKDGEDFTEEMLEEPKLILLISYDLNKAGEKGLARLEEFHLKAKEKGYKIIGLTASDEDIISQTQKKFNLTFDYYFCDATTLKTIERANPSIVILEKGTITQKRHYNDIDKVKL